MHTPAREVLGGIGAIDLNTAHILHSLAHRSNSNVTVVAGLAPCPSLPVTDLSTLPNVLDMNPLSPYIQVTASFIKEWNWNRIGLVAESSNYYQFTTDLLQNALAENPNVLVTPLINIRRTSDSVNAVKQIKDYGTHIVVIVVSTKLACSLLQEAYGRNLTWPMYAWILLAPKYPEVSFRDCEMDGAFIVKDLYFETSFVNDGFFTCNQHLNSTSSFSSSRILLDSLKAVRDLNEISSLKTPFTGVIGQNKFRNGVRLANITISLVLKSGVIEVASFNSELNQLSVLNESLFTGQSPKGETNMVMLEISPPRKAIVITIFFFCLIFVTLMLFLYIYFRKEPEIKATSVSVSICMFLGCYLSLAFVPALFLPTVTGTETTVSCNFQIWLSGNGLPVTMILAILFVKMFRVYIIFLRPHSYKRKLLSNTLLFLYIWLFLLPNIVVLTLWTSIDTFSPTRFEIEEKDRIVVLYRCKSNHSTIWLALILLYVTGLIIALAVLAFKSSSVRYKNFKDTKATNAFTFLIILVIITTVSYWYFFRSLEESFYSIKQSQIALYSGHFALPLLCQIFLFVPKIYAPLKRCFQNNSTHIQHDSHVATSSQYFLFATPCVIKHAIDNVHITQ